MELTNSQRVRVEGARERLAEANAAQDPDEMAVNVGALAYHVETLLGIIAELTGAER